MILSLYILLLCYVFILHFSITSGSKRYGKSISSKDHVTNKYGSYQQSENFDFDSTNEVNVNDNYSYNKEKHDKVNIISSYTKSFKIKTLVALTSGIFHNCNSNYMSCITLVP